MSEMQGFVYTITSPGLLLSKRLLSIRVVLNDQRTRRISTQAPPPLHRQLARKLQPTRALNRLQGHLKVGDRLVIRDGCIGKHKRSKRNIAARLSILGENNLVEVRGHRDGGRRSDHLVLDVPLVVHGILLGEVQRAGDDADGGVLDCQAAAEVLEVCPVIAVEALADLWAHVGEVEGLVHSLLGPLAVRSRDLMAAIIAAAEVILQQSAELLRHGIVLEEGAVLAIAVPLGEARRRNMLSDPMGVSKSSVVARDEG